METLSLPEPAASLLRRTGAIIDAAVLELTGQARAWVLGGGTVLAARWRHRASKDADITVREGTGLGAVYSDVDPTLARAMAEDGPGRRLAQPSGGEGGSTRSDAGGDGIRAKEPGVRERGSGASALGAGGGAERGQRRGRGTDPNHAAGSAGGAGEGGGSGERAVDHLPAVAV